MPQLNLRVGASIDRNLQVAYQPLVEGAKRAKAAIEAESKKAGRAISTETKKGTTAAEAAFAALEAEVTTGFAKSMSKAGAAAKQFGKEAATSFNATKRTFADMAKDAEKQMAAMDRANKKAAGQSSGGTARRMAGGLWNAAGGTNSIVSGAKLAGSIGIGAAKMAMAARSAIISSLAHGAGVETDITSIAKKNYDLETNAQNIANSGYITGDKRNNTRVRKEDLVAQALDVGQKTGSDANVALEGLGKFVSKTGDLKTGRDIMEQMAIYSKATGSSMEDMMDASGDLANQLDGVEDKGKAVKDLMRGFVGQGKLGAVEIKDLASQMAKIGAASSRFEGGQKSIVEMGVLAQSARGRGGSPSASSAATSVSAFANLFSKGKRLDAFDKLGVDTHGEGGRVKDPKTIIMNAMDAAFKKGGMKDFDRLMGTMFSDVRSRSTTLSFEDKFKAAGGGEAGIKAATEEFDRLEKAMVSDEEIMVSFSRAMKTSNSQAEVFNNQIRKSALQMQADLAPAMASLAQAIVPAVAELGKWVTFMTGDKQAQTITGIAEEDTDNAIRSTKKQTEGGKISDAQIEQNRIAANEAFEAKNRAAAEVKAKQESIAKNKEEGNYNWWSNSMLRSDDADSVRGRVFGTTEEGDQKSLEGKKAALAKANETYEKMIAVNEDVKRKLDGKLLVQIANVEELKAAVTPPVVGADGRQPPPEANPR